MSEFDPFERGPAPVGVVTRILEDESRGRQLPVEIWYPAAERYRGQDLDDATRDRFRPLPLAPEVAQDAVRDATPDRRGPCPLVVFSHGFGSQRRQTAHLCTHWASHGYAVASVDHVGNRALDMMRRVRLPAPEPEDPRAVVRGFLADRPADASFAIDRMLAGAGPVAVDPERIGLAGHSFGGWTALVLAGRDPRVRAALALAPAGGRTGSEGPADEVARALDLGWDRAVPTLYLVAEVDSLLPLDGMRDLVARTRAPCRGVALRGADHFHFCDRVAETQETFKSIGPVIARTQAAGGQRDVRDAIAAMRPSEELCPPEQAYALLRGLGLAHMDAHLRRRAWARALLEHELEPALSKRGIAVEILR